MIGEGVYKGENRIDSLILPLEIVMSRCLYVELAHKNKVIS